MKIEDYVQLANIIKKSVQNLNQKLNHLQSQKLIIVRINHHDKIQGRKSLIDNSSSGPIDKITSLKTPSQNQLTDLLDPVLPLLSTWVLRVPFCQSDFTLPIY